MIKSSGLLVLFFVFSFPNCFGQQKNYLIHTVAFYNFENLFDTINDPATNDDEWTPKGAQHWTAKKYHQKLENLSRVLLEIGSAENTNSPTFIACSEIENRGVLEDLIKQPKLIQKDYGIIHFDSPERALALTHFYDKWKHETLVMQKWLSVQASSSLPNTLESMLNLEKDAVYDKTVPNLFRSLVGVYANNFINFHNKQQFLFLQIK